jgi:hypothetical protein
MCEGGVVVIDNPKVKVGQIWRDNDPRFNRRMVKIMSLPLPGFSRVMIMRVLSNGERWWRKGRKKHVVAPRTLTEIDRFGKTGRRGFRLLVDVD